MFSSISCARWVAAGVTTLVLFLCFTVLHLTQDSTPPAHPVLTASLVDLFRKSYAEVEVSEEDAIAFFKAPAIKAVEKVVPLPDAAAATAAAAPPPATTQWQLQPSYIIDSAYYAPRWCAEESRAHVQASQCACITLADAKATCARHDDCGGIMSNDGMHTFYLRTLPLVGHRVENNAATSWRKVDSVGDIARRAAKAAAAAVPASEQVEAGSAGSFEWTPDPSLLKGHYFAIVTGKAYHATRAAAMKRTWLKRATAAGAHWTFTSDADDDALPAVKVHVGDEDPATTQDVHNKYFPNGMEALMVSKGWDAGPAWVISQRKWLATLHWMCEAKLYTEHRYPEPYRWFSIVDDDAFVNLHTLDQTLNNIDSADDPAELLLGFVNGGSKPQLHGGAGYHFSRSALAHICTKCTAHGGIGGCEDYLEQNPTAISEGAMAHCFVPGRGGCDVATPTWLRGAVPWTDFELFSPNGPHRAAQLEGINNGITLPDFTVMHGYKTVEAIECADELVYWWATAPKEEVRKGKPRSPLLRLSSTPPDPELRAVAWCDKA